MYNGSNGIYAVKIVRNLILSFEKKEGVFSDTKELLENQIPVSVQYRSKQHANFLFYLISQDHGTKSYKLYERAKNLFVDFSYIFDPESVVNTFDSEDSKSLLNIIKMLGVRYPNNSVKYWYRNSIKLNNEYNSDARNIFSSNYGPEILKRIKEFHGFGPKISSLLFRVFVGVGMANPERVDEIGFPTDIHDTRIAGLTKIADIPDDITENNYSPYAKTAQKVWQKACNDENVNWLQVDRALWILGSKGCVNERHHDCPIKEYCIKGQNSGKECEEVLVY